MTEDQLDRLGPPSFTFEVPCLSQSLTFQGRPLSVTPAENTVGFLYGPTADGGLTQIGAGVFRKGKWERLSKAKGPEPSHWVVLADA